MYTTLARLARDGKAVAGPPEHGDGPDRKRYSITAAGMAEVDTWLTTPAEPEPHLQPVLFAKVTLALMLGRPADSYLDAQRFAHLKRMQELTQLKGTGSLAGHSPRRLRPVPPGSGPALDRYHRGPARAN